MIQSPAEFRVIQGIISLETTEQRQCHRVSSCGWSFVIGYSVLIGCLEAAALICNGITKISGFTNGVNFDLSNMEETWRLLNLDQRSGLWWSEDQEEAPSRRSVAELAGRFKSPAPAHDAAGHETEKPVRRRPPRSLQLPKTQGDEEEPPPGVTSPLPAKAKRNSALIEKLQANLALSPVALLPSPKSPGFRLLPPAFPLPSPVSTSVTTVTTSSTATPSSPVASSPLTEEEGPVSFEAPPTAAEGSILSNINKGRARHSIRRRPPSRHHRKSSSGEEVGVTNEGGDTSVSPPTQPDDKITDRGEKEEGGEVFKEEVRTDEEKEDERDVSAQPEEKQTHEEDQSKSSVKSREQDEKKDEKKEEKIEEKIEEKTEEKTSMGGEEKEDTQEKSSREKEEDLTEGATNTDSREEEKSEVTFISNVCLFVLINSDFTDSHFSLAG
ncbi:hypothetical protein L3Q82_022623 [Scortum barcoo]|uniref:Uncharacterized protein n=1 Tax=Scortum barcoo TaxID=214431 RepID=A0ACB8X2U7_9TELE|nr:hypothetical protein L3Q82_022623 [Scortum barcoo]